MNTFTTEFHPRVNNIKNRILSDDNLQNVACLCHDWADFVTEISEWGIYQPLKTEFYLMAIYKMLLAYAMTGQILLLRFQSGESTN